VRLDKWLKVTRLIKRRTVAKEVVERGLVAVNGRPAKPGTDLKVGDRVQIQLPRGRLTVQVLATPESVPAREAARCYAVEADEGAYLDSEDHSL
jgi:ribosomal 50S subunit-recycling heat shock protein